MKAVWSDTVIAETSNEALIKIEGNWYFPPDAIKKEYYRPSDMHTECIWKGTASYYDIVVNGEVNEGAAWYYPKPKDGSLQLVKHDFTNYVAFWRGVEVIES